MSSKGEIFNQYFILKYMRLMHYKTLITIMIKKYPPTLIVSNENNLAVLEKYLRNYQLKAMFLESLDKMKSTLP